MHLPRGTLRRDGFTLVEILAVVAIIAILAAITAGGINRVRSSQMSRNTEGTIAKLQLALDQKWKDLADRVTEDKVKGRIPADVLTLCAGDRERAAALWMYIQARREFPQTFAEAQHAISISGLPAAPYLQPRATYAAVSGSFNPQEQGAILLHLILSESGAGGTRFDADDAMRGAKGFLGSYEVFIDAWKTPITFVRHAQSAELDQPPYVRPGSSLNDPLDPQGRLSYFLSHGSYGSMQAAFGVSFNNHNRQITVISAGANRNWDGLYDQDNVVGYRLRRQGARGD